MLLLALVAFGLARCDTVEPSEGEDLVVEAFLHTGEPLPAVTLRQTRPLAELIEGGGAAASGAEVWVELDGVWYVYEAVPEQPGQYRPVQPDVRVQPRSPIKLDVRWQAQRATAGSTAPPPIKLDRVQVQAPEKPQRAVLLDTLAFGALPREGFIYPVDVTLWWTSTLDEDGADSLYWIRTKVEPFTPFSSTVIDFFLRPESVLRERALLRDAYGRRSWRGTYAVAVDRATDPLPRHRLKVALLRSGPDYARFADSRDTPERREPISNVEGALGIVAGISVDSLQLTVE